MKEQKYVSGQYCIDICCPVHEKLKGLEGDEYVNKKNELCTDCATWKFYTWLRDNNWRIVKTVPEMSAKSLAAAIKGIDPVRVEDLTMDEILCL